MGLIKKYKDLRSKNKRLLALKKAQKTRQINEKRKNDAKYYSMLKNLKHQSRINTEKILSDRGYMSYSVWKRIKEKFCKTKFCWVTLHYPDNVDIVRRYPMPKPFTIKVDNDLYIFSPKSFRYINDNAMLYFYHSVPFSILHEPKKSYNVPSLDTSAFAAVQRSKFIQDVTDQPDEMPKGIIIAVLVISIIAVIACIINSALLFKIIKAMGG